MILCIATVKVCAYTCVNPVMTTFHVALYRIFTDTKDCKMDKDLCIISKNDYMTCFQCFCKKKTMRKYNHGMVKQRITENN